MAGNVAAVQEEVMGLRETLVWLFVIDLGIACGAGLYEQRLIIPEWFTRAPGAGLQVNREAMRRTDPGRKFWGLVTTVPLPLLTIAILVLAWRADAPLRGWLLVAGTITLLERVVTFSYFIPTALKLMRTGPGALSESHAAKVASRWMRLNLVRAALALGGWLAALKALSLDRL
jgi:hypothetical protein